MHTSGIVQKEVQQTYLIVRFKEEMMNIFAKGNDG